MEPKKNPKANVGRNSSLFFAIGLALMLFLTNYAINYKTYDKEAIDIGQLNLDEELEEEIPITEQIQTPPPPPPPPPPPEPTAIEQFTMDIEGKTLPAFYDAAFGGLLERTPETIVALGLETEYPLDNATLNRLGRQ